MVRFLTLMLSLTVSLAFSAQPMYAAACFDSTVTRNYQCTCSDGTIDQVEITECSGFSGFTCSDGGGRVQCGSSRCYVLTSGDCGLALKNNGKGGKVVASCRPQKQSELPKLESLGAKK